MSSGIAPQRAEEWTQFMTNVTYDDSPQVYSDAMILYPGSAEVKTGSKNFNHIRAGAFACEIKLTITSAGLQTPIITAYTCPDGDPALLSDDAATFRGGVTPMRWTLAAGTLTNWTKALHWEDVGSGFMLGFLAGGAETHQVNAWYRRLRLGNPAMS